MNALFSWYTCHLSLKLLSAICTKLESSWTWNLCRSGQWLECLPCSHSRSPAAKRTERWDEHRYQNRGGPREVSEAQKKCSFCICNACLCFTASRRASATLWGPRRCLASSKPCNSSVSLKTSSPTIRCSAIWTFHPGKAMTIRTRSKKSSRRRRWSGSWRPGSAKCTTFSCVSEAKSFKSVNLKILQSLQITMCGLVWVDTPDVISEP